MWGKPPYEASKSCYAVPMMKSVGSVEFFALDDGDPLVRLMVNDDFHALTAVDRVRFLMAISHVAFLAASQIGQENPDEMEEILEMMQSLSLEPVSSKLN
jgi:hypothetical protein